MKVIACLALLGFIGAAAAAGAPEFKPVVSHDFGSKTAKLVQQNMPPQPQAIVNEFILPKPADMLPENSKWFEVAAVKQAPSRTLGTIELLPITQTYTVHSTDFKTENIKQPITEPVMQPYLQRYIQQAQPVLQPIVQRVYQPIVHRQLNPFLETKIEKAADLATIVKPVELTKSTNKPIVGADMMALPISKSVKPL